MISNLVIENTINAWMFGTFLAIQYLIILIEPLSRAMKKIDKRS